MKTGKGDALYHQMMVWIYSWLGITGSNTVVTHTEKGEQEDIYFVSCGEFFTPNDT